MDSNKYSVKVGIKLDEKAIANIDNELNTKLKDKNVNISMDTKNLQQITDLLNNIYLELGRIESKNGFSNTTKGAKDAAKGVDNLNQNLDKTTKHIKNQAFATDNWAYNWSKAMQSFLTYNTVTQFFNTVSDGIKDMIVQVKELDDALVELQKVTDLEGKSLEKFIDDAYKAGETVAKTGTEMIEAATSFAKAGYKDEALELGTIAAMYTNIADEEIDAANAADMIIAQMKAFNIEAEDSIHIIDAINEVSNNYAVSSADIANNLGKASAVMANAGNSMEQYIGLMTAATEVTRNASKAANGLKTLTLRLQGMNDEGEKDLELMSQMDALFNKLGISAYNQSGELKNTYEMLEALAGVYGDLTNAEKAYVTETIAGKYQAQNAAAILSNWETAVNATTTALNSNGSAAAENEKVLDSIQGHLQQLNSAWEELSKNIFNSDFLKFVIDLGTAFLNVANSDFGKFIIQTVAVIGTLGLLKNAYDGINNKIKNFSVGLTKNSAALLINNTNLSKQDKNLKKQISQILTSKGAYDKETGSISKNTIAEIKNTLSKNGVNKAEQKKIVSQLTSTNATKSLTAATIAQTVAQEALNAAMTMGISLLISAAVSGISALINSSKEAAEKAAEAEEELRNKAIESGEELNEKNKSLDDLISQYKLLQQELDNEQTSYSRSAEIRSEIIDLQKQINDLLGEENNGINLINDGLEETIKKQNKIKETNAKDYMSKNASAIKTAQDNLSKNYYGSKSNRKIATEERYWNEWDWDEDTEKFAKKYESLMQALANSSPTGSISYSSGWGGKDKNHHGFDKESFIDLDSNISMTAKEALKMWQDAYDDLSKNKKQYMDEYGLSEDDYDQIIATTNDNVNKLSDYIKKQEEVLEKAAESMIYSDDTYSEKMTELQVAQAEYNKAKAEGDEEGMQTAIDKMAKLQDYVDTIDNDTVKDYFQNILNEWDSQINQSKFGEKLSNWFEGQNKELKDKLKNLNIDGDTFSNLFKNFQNGVTEGLDEDTISIFKELQTLMDELGISAEDLQSYLENLGYVFPGAAKQTTEAVTALSELEQGMKNLNEAIDEVQNAYKTLYDAMDEYNQNGYISMDTLQSILSLEDKYLQYLINEDGQLQLNTQAFENIANARLDDAEALAVQQAMEEMNILTAQKDQGEIEKLRKKYENFEVELGNVAAKYDEVTAAAAKFKATEGISTQDKELADDIVKNLDAKLAAINATRLGIGKNFASSMGASSGSGSGSSSSKKEWWETAYDDLKDQFSYSEITIEQYINGLENLLGKVGKGTEAWRKINKELQKQKLDKVKDDYNAGRISLDQYIISLQNLQKAYAKGTDAWNDLADAIKKAKLDKLKEQQDDLKSALSAVNNVLDKQIDKYEEAKDAADEKYDDEIEKLEEIQDKLSDQDDEYQRAQKAVVDFLNEQLNAIEEQRDTIENYYDNVIEAIDKMNEDTKESIELAEAYEALMNAMTQKTKKVYKEGLGWIWTTDAEAIRDAKQTYEDLLTSTTTKEIEEQKNKTVNSLEEQIEALQDYIDSWDEVFDKFDNEKNRNLADILLGENWSEMVSQLDPQIVDDFSDAYYELQKNLEETEKQIEELNKQKEEEDEYWDKLIQDLKDYKGEWSDVADVYEEAQNALKARQIMGANWEQEILERRLDVLENFKNKYNAILAEIDKVDNMSTNQASNYTALRLPGYANGGEVDYTGLAVLHGTPNKPEYVLNNNQMRNLLGNLTKPKITSNLGTSSSVVNNYSFGNIELPNVTNARQFANELKSLLNITKNQ